MWLWVIVFAGYAHIYVCYRVDVWSIYHTYYMCVLLGLYCNPLYLNNTNASSILAKYGDAVTVECSAGYHVNFNNAWSNTFTAYCQDDRYYHPIPICESE